MTSKTSSRGGVDIPAQGAELLKPAPDSEIDGEGAADREDEPAGDEARRCDGSSHRVCMPAHRTA